MTDGIVSCRFTPVWWLGVRGLKGKAPGPRPKSIDDGLGFSCLSKKHIDARGEMRFCGIEPAFQCPCLFNCFVHVSSTTPTPCPRAVRSSAMHALFNSGSNCRFERVVCVTKIPSRDVSLVVLPQHCCCRLLRLLWLRLSTRADPPRFGNMSTPSVAQPAAAEHFTRPIGCVTKRARPPFE
ncbi:hypothetical protein BKA81DRAFT_41883 [Phyllosticta paracitricarpa]